MKTIDIQCDNCGNFFAKELREFKRQSKNKRTKFFCSRTCAAIKNNKEHPRKGNPELLVQDNRRDEYTQFRWFILRSQYRDRKKNYGCDLTTAYLKQLWEDQNGICPFTGWSLILPKNSDGWEHSSPMNASLDRVDNKIGYMQGNVRFIAVMANLARQSFTDEQLLSFCKAVTAHVS